MIVRVSLLSPSSARVVDALKRRAQLRLVGVGERRPRADEITVVPLDKNGLAGVERERGAAIVDALHALEQRVVGIRAGDRE